MRRWCQPHDQEPRLGIAKPRHRLAPVLPVTEFALLLASDLLAPGDETGAEATPNHDPVKMLE
jgi:hypothetical protein